MKHLRIPLIALFALTIQTVDAAFAELHFGNGFAETWDFSDSISTGLGGPWDFSAGNTVASTSDSEISFGSFLISNFPAQLTVMQAGITYESVLEAPEDPSAYSTLFDFSPNRVWIVKTQEGHYAKVRFFNEFFAGPFEYTYQDNGTRYFTEPLPSETVTWGRIKALYR